MESNVNKRIVIAAAAALIAATGTFFALRGSAPGDLERLTDASERAGEESEEITANLERIAANLAQGASLPADTEEIRALTDEQEDSLERLAALLEDQLAALGAGTRALEGTEDTTGDLARLSRAQARILKRTVAALKDLRDYSSNASRASADLARAARYGARLAEDSRKAFSR